MRRKSSPKSDRWRTRSQTLSRPPSVAKASAEKKK
jgi:hypothetical protein